MVEDLTSWLKGRIDSFPGGEPVYIWLLPLLQHPWSNAVNALKVANASSIELPRLVECGLRWNGADFWPMMAMSWLEDDFPLNDDIADALDALSKRKGVQQTLRHKAFAMARRYERAQTSAGPPAV